MKRILSFFAAFSIAISLCVSSYAVEVTSFSSQVSMWDVFAHLISAGSDSVGDWGFLFQYLGAYASSSVCPVSDDNWHHGEVDSFVGVNEDGYTASCTCVYCGKSFTTVVEESDLNAAYSTYISTLPSTTVSSSDLISTLNLSFSHLLYIEDDNEYLSDSDYSFSAVTSASSTSVTLDLPNLTETPSFICLSTDSICFDDCWISISSFPNTSSSLFFLSVTPVSIYNSSSTVCQFDVSPFDSTCYSCGLWSLGSDLGVEILNSGSSDLQVFLPAGEYCFFAYLGGAFDYGFDSATHRYTGELSNLKLNVSVSSDSGSIPTSTTNDRFGLFMEELDEWNNTYGYDANEYAANYFISPDDGDSLYSPAVFSESTMTFTEPTTGDQFLCTDWLYYYDPDQFAWSSDDASFHEQYGMYMLTLADSSYYVGSTAADIICIMYADDFIRIGAFVEDSSADAGYTMLSYQDYSYVIVSQTECGLNGHTYTYETVTEATCSTPGERKYTCSVCGDEYAEDIPATGNHTYKSSVTQEATCAASGVMTYTCSTCGTEYTETIAPTGVHSYEYSVSVDPTCTADGTGLYTCSVCGDQYTETLPATGHSGTLIEYVSPEYDENGNLTVAGYSVYECTICGAQYTVADEATAEKEGFFSWLWNQFSKLIESIFDGLASGIKYLLENIIGAITDWIIRVVNWVFDLFDGDALSSFFGWFSDDNEILNADFGVSSSTEVDVWAYS